LLYQNKLDLQAILDLENLMGYSASSVIVAIAVCMVSVFVVKNMSQYHIPSRAGKIWYVREAQNLQYSPNLEPVMGF
jgi:hypothetical protein